MVWTFDFILTAWRDKTFREQLENALASQSDLVLYTEIHQLSFHAAEQVVLVTLNPDSPFLCKVVPAKITYRGVKKMLQDDWESLEQKDITYV